MRCLWSVSRRMARSLTSDPSARTGPTKSGSFSSTTSRSRSRFGRRTHQHPAAVLARHRRGQGVFRANVLLHQTRRRVTLVDDPRHVRASHIKPWRDATDNERLDGSTGSLLSPHVDHLFDRGYLTFSPAQRLLVVPEARDRLVDAWGIHTDVDVGPFTREQSAYLDYHRANVFGRHRSEFFRP